MLLSNTYVISFKIILLLVFSLGLFHWNYSYFSICWDFPKTCLLKSFKEGYYWFQIQSKKKEKTGRFTKEWTGLIDSMSRHVCPIPWWRPTIWLGSLCSGAGLAHVCCLELHDCKTYLAHFLLCLWNSLAPFFDETDLPTFTSFSQFSLCYMPYGNLAQDFCTISHPFGHKSYASNNDVLGRGETVMPVISNMESTFSPSAADKCAAHCAAIAAWIWCGYRKMAGIVSKSYVKKANQLFLLSFFINGQLGNWKIGTYKESRKKAFKSPTKLHHLAGSRLLFSVNQFF